MPYLVYSSGHIWHPVVPQWSVRVYSWSFAGNMRPGSNPSRHSSGSPNCRWEHMGGFPLSQGFMDLFGLDWTFNCLKQLLLEEWCFDALKNWLCFEFSHLASWANCKQTQVLSTLKHYLFKKSFAIILSKLLHLLQEFFKVINRNSFGFLTGETRLLLDLLKTSAAIFDKLPWIIFNFSGQNFGSKLFKNFSDRISTGILAGLLQ